MVACQLPKLNARVRFPLPAPPPTASRSTLISILLAGQLVGKVDSRMLVGIGVALMGASLYMMTGFALDQPSHPVIVSGIV